MKSELVRFVKVYVRSEASAQSSAFPLTIRPEHFARSELQALCDQSGPPPPTRVLSRADHQEHLHCLRLYIPGRFSFSASPSRTLFNPSQRGHTTSRLIAL